MEQKKVVTRFAPSPTGYMHVGGVRTALYAWLFARKNNGTFILRIEDTDKEREVEGSIPHIIESLKWLGIEWDEGIDIGGPNAPYLQSERIESYNKYAKILIKKGLAYADPYTKEEVEAFRQKSEAEKRPFLYRDYRPENPPVWDGTQPLRFKVSEVKRTIWNDVVFGELSAGEEALDDFILIKSDGYPTYNFAHIIDDLEMGVTHIMRAQEFISSTPKFISLYEALEITPPQIATLPPIMAADGKKKLGKRDGAKDILDYRNEGYLPEAMMNFLAFLGWNPGDDRELMSKEELIKEFSLERVHHSGAGFNEEKLNWFNKEYIKKLDPETLQNKIFEFLPKELQNEKLVPIIRERIAKFNDIQEMVANKELDFFTEAPAIDMSKINYKDTSIEKTKEYLKNISELLEGVSDFTAENIKNAVMEYANTTESRGAVLHPMRYTLSGLDKSPDPFIIASILGKNETISRLQKVV